jgi:chromosomal replication initiation ATPase DnaA
MVITTDYIIETVCKVLELDRDKLLNYNKRGEYVDGRFIAMYLIREKLKSTDKHKDEVPFYYKEISDIFNRKQHGTSMYACKTVPHLLRNDKKFKVKYELVIKSL